MSQKLSKTNNEATCNNYPNLPAGFFTTKIPVDNESYTLKELCQKHNVDFQKIIEYVVANNLCDDEIDFVSIVIKFIPNYYMNILGGLAYFCD